MIELSETRVLMTVDSHKIVHDGKTSTLPFDARLSLRPARFELSCIRDNDDAQFEMSFMENVLNRDPCNEDVLMLLGHAYTRRGDYEKGLDIDRRLVRLRPGDPTAYYNMACSLSLLRKLDDAMLALQQAASLGYRDVKFMLKDPDLANLRQDDRFGKFLRRIKGQLTNDS